MKTKIQIGQRYGRGTVIAKHAHRKAHWLLLCECGKEYSGYSSNLRLGYSRSCGCIRSEAAMERIKKLHESVCLPDGEAGVRALYATYKNVAHVNSRLFTLTLEEFKKLTSSVCFYCGEPPTQYTRQKRERSRYIYNGIDRQDNTIGYVLENCVPCCMVCNYMKHDLSVTEFINHCFLVTNQINRKRSAEMSDPADIER